MFSLITGARAGITFLNSGFEAMRQPAGRGSLKVTIEVASIKNNAFMNFVFINPPHSMLKYRRDKCIV
jgi:hypothetical protein